MKLFIGNLSYDTSESELREVFSEFEPILELVRPINRETGQPRGFAFITLKDDETGEEAIEALN
ncbi:MAG: RNA-binding protein [Verrucomicrobiota bacterium]